MRELGATVVDVGMVDSPESAIGCFILEKGRGEIVFLYISTYALSSTVLPIIQRLNVPVIILNVQPVPLSIMPL